MPSWGPARAVACGALLTALSGCFGKIDGGDEAAARGADAAAPQEAPAPEADGDGAPPAAPPAAQVEPCPEEGTVTLAEGSPSALLVDDEHLYFSELGPTNCYRWCTFNGGPIARIPRCGGRAEIVVEGEHLVAQLVDGGDVLYALLRRSPETSLDGNPAGVLRIQKASGGSPGSPSARDTPP